MILVDLIAARRFASRCRQDAAWRSVAFSFLPFLIPPLVRPPPSRPQIFRPPARMLYCFNRARALDVQCFEPRRPGGGSGHIPKRRSYEKGPVVRPCFILFTGFYPFRQISRFLLPGLQASAAPFVFKPPFHKPTANAAHNFQRQRVLEPYFSMCAVNSNRKPKISKFFVKTHDMKPVHICTVLQIFLFPQDISAPALTAFPFFCYNCTKLRGFQMLFS